MSTPQFFQQSLKTTTTNAIATAPGTSQYLILKAKVVNNDSSARTVTAYLVPSGGSVGTGTIAVDALSVAAGQEAVLSLSGQALVQNGAFFAKCSVTNKMTLSMTVLQLP